MLAVLQPIHQFPQFYGHLFPITVIPKKTRINNFTDLLLLLLLLLLHVLVDAVVSVEGRPGQVPLDLAGLPDAQPHADVQDDQDEHREDEEQEGAQLVHRVVLGGGEE